MQCECYDIRFAQARGSLGDVKHVMTGRAEKGYQRCRNTFVGEPAQISTVDNVFVSEIVGCKCLRCPDICISQPRVVRKDRLNRHTGAKFSQNQFYRDARAPNNRLTVHDLRIRFAALVGHGTLARTSLGRLNRTIAEVSVSVSAGHVPQNVCSTRCSGSGGSV